jgi:predicted DNA-binding transcriptional regulator AlpA
MSGCSSPGRDPNERVRGDDWHPDPQTDRREALELLTVAEAATVLRLSRPTIYRLVSDGTLPAHKSAAASASTATRCSPCSQPRCA